MKAQFLVYIVIFLCAGTLRGQVHLNLHPFSVEELKNVIEHSDSEDSIVVAYSILARKLVGVDNNASIQLYDTALKELAEYEGEINKDSIYNYTKLLSAIPLINGAQYSEANQILQEQYLYYDSTSNRKQVAHVLILQGFLLTEISNFDQAAAHFLKAEKIYEEIDYVGGMNDANNRMGIIYSILKDHEKAKEYYHKVEKRCEERGTTFLLRAATNNLAETYTNLGDTLNAKKWCKKIIAIRQGHRDNQSLAYLNKNLADLAFLNRDLEGGIAYLDSALYYAKAVKVASQIIEIKLLLSEKYEQLGRSDKKLAVLLSAQEDLESTEYSLMNADVYHAIAECYKEKRDFEKATSYYSLFVEAKENLGQVQDERELKKREESAKIQLYNQKIAEVESSRAMQSLAFKKERQRNLFLWLFSIFSVTALAFLLKAVIDRKKNQDELLMQKIAISENLKDKEILLKEIHHRVKNNLQVVSSMLNLNLRHVNDPQAKSILLESRNRVKSMALIHQKLYQEDQLKGVNLSTYIKSLGNNLLHSYRKETYQVNIIYDIADLVLDVDTLIPLGLIVNELISNSLKHAFIPTMEGVIKISVHEKLSVLFLSVADNGLGIDFSKKKTSESFGMTLIEYLGEKLKAEFNYRQESGTRVDVKIHQYSIYR